VVQPSGTFEFGGWSDYVLTNAVIACVSLYSVILAPAYIQAMYSNQTLYGCATIDLY